MKKVEYIQALRELADFVESHELPETISGYVTDQDTFTVPHLQVYPRSAVELGKFAAAIGSFDKTASEDFTGIEKTLTSGARIEVKTSREAVCKKKVVGTRTIPATEEQIIPAKPEREEEIVEWECPESLIALATQEELNVTVS